MRNVFTKADFLVWHYFNNTIVISFLRDHKMHRKTWTFKESPKEQIKWKMLQVRFDFKLKMEEITSVIIEYWMTFNCLYQVRKLQKSRRCSVWEFYVDLYKDADCIIKYWFLPTSIDFEIYSSIIACNDDLN